MYSVGVVSLGCSKNRVDTELMLGILRKAGYRITADEREADILIVNTCGFIDRPSRRASIRCCPWQGINRKGSSSCWRPPAALRSAMNRRFAGYAGGGSGAGREPVPHAAPRDRGGAGGQAAQLLRAGVNRAVRRAVLTTAPYTAYVRIADGCDNRCAYCAIPLIRGGFRSRDMQSVLEEIRALAERGVKEHVLVAQDTSRLGMDTHGRSCCRTDGPRGGYPRRGMAARALLLSREVDDTLLEAMASRPNICRYLDLPLQHADPQLLRRMNRRGDIEQTRAFLKKARGMGFTLRTTFITGFPGETEEDFTELAEFVKDVRFERMGCFAYSQEEDTPAALLPDQIDEDVKERRAEILMDDQMAIMEAQGEELLGQTLEVLVEGFDRYAECWFGRSWRDAPDIDGKVFFTVPEGRRPRLGSFVK